MKLLISILLLLSCAKSFCQHNYKLTLEANYGIQGNFFVRGYDEDYAPGPHTYFYDKNFIGTTGGIEAQLQISDKSYLSAGFIRSENRGRKNYAGQLNGVDVFINNFQLRYINRIIQLGYGHYLPAKKSRFAVEGGLMLLYDNDQIIQIEDWDDTIMISENNFKSSYSVELGGYLGVAWMKQIDTKFYAGIKSRIYFAASTGTFEILTITPTLSYCF